MSFRCLELGYAILYMFFDTIFKKEQESPISSKQTRKKRRYPQRPGRFLAGFHSKFLYSHLKMYYSSPLQHYDSQMFISQQRVYKYKMNCQLSTGSGGPCLSCMGFYQTPCYCRDAQDVDGSSVNIRFISIQAEILPLDPIQHHHETTGNQPPVLPPLPPRQEQNNGNARGRRRATRDNVAYKRISKVLQDCYRTLTGEKVPLEIREHYYKESYFMMVLTDLEKKGKLDQIKRLFTFRMDIFSERIRRDHANEPQYLQHLQVLVERHLEALDLFLEDRLLESMKTLYDYESMRQKQHFWKAMREIKEMREDVGLPAQCTLQ